MKFLSSFFLWTPAGRRILLIVIPLFVALAFSCKNGDVNRHLPINEPKTEAVDVHGSTYSAAQGLGRDYFGGMIFAGVSPNEDTRSENIVYSYLFDDSAQVFVQNLRKSTTDQITSSPHWNTNPILTATGRFVVFVSDEDSPDGEFYSFDLVEKKKRRLLPSRVFRADGVPFASSSAVCKPGSDVVAFCASESGKSSAIFVADLVRGIVKCVSPGSDDCYCPAWSSDGKCIFYATNSPLNGMPPKCQIRKSFLHGELGVPVTTESNEVRLPLGTNSAGTILYLMRGYEENRLSALNLKSPSEIDDLIKNDITMSVCFNAELQRFGIVMSTKDDPYSYNLYGFVVGSQPRSLTTNPGYLCEPSFSSDGQYILFVADEKGAPARGFGKISRVHFERGPTIVVTTAKDEVQK